MKHDIPVERLTELLLLRDIFKEEIQVIKYYELKGLKYNTPFNLNKIESRINEIQEEFLDEYRIENYANLTESKD